MLVISAAGALIAVVAAAHPGFLRHAESSPAVGINVCAEMRALLPPYCAPHILCEEILCNMTAYQNTTTSFTSTLRVRPCSNATVFPALIAWGVNDSSAGGNEVYTFNTSGIQRTRIPVTMPPLTNATVFLFANATQSGNASFPVWDFDLSFRDCEVSSGKRRCSTRQVPVLSGAVTFNCSA